MFNTSMHSCVNTVLQQQYPGNIKLLRHWHIFFKHSFCNNGYIHTAPEIVRLKHVFTDWFGFQSLHPTVKPHHTISFWKKETKKSAKPMVGKSIWGNAFQLNWAFWHPYVQNFKGTLHLFSEALITLTRSVSVTISDPWGVGSTPATCYKGGTQWVPSVLCISEFQ